MVGDIYSCVTEGLAANLAPATLMVKEIDGQAVVTVRGSGYADSDSNVRSMTLTPEQLLMLAHALIKYVTRKGIGDAC